MGLVWITGVSGTGKSTVRLELARRGYPSFDADEDGIAVWRLRTTDEAAVYDPGADNWLASGTPLGNQ